jgi:polyphosphate glucokinase
MTYSDSATGLSGAGGSGATPHAFGVDIGGSGIKGGIVDLDTGQLIGERFKLPTPQPATPSAVAKTVAAVVNEFGWKGPLGVTYPGVVTQGVVQTAANVDKSWIGTNARDVIAKELNGQKIVVLNDADAAGLAEERYGAGKDKTGVVVLLTFGTGIGSAVIHNGILLPNTELGHLEVDGKEAEHRAASSVRNRRGLSYKDWAKQVTRVLVALENAFWPDLFIAGGGISRKADQWVPLLENRTPVVPATLQNTAGIVGAAMAATRDVTH